MAFPNCSHVSALDTSRPTGADYIYCLAAEVRGLKESVAAGIAVQAELVANVVEPRIFDPHWASVVLSMPMSSTFADVTGNHTLTRDPEIVINSDSTLFGLPTAVFDGIHYAYTDATTFLGLGDTYTIDVWVNTTTPNVDFLCFDIANAHYFSNYPGNTVNWMNGAAKEDFAPNLLDGNWHLISVSATPTETKLFADGVLGNTMIPDLPVNTGTRFLNLVNRPAVPAVIFSGRMAHLRITKGVARYTTDFDLPTAPWPTTD